MKIQIVAGTAVGATELAAFDAAEMGMGLADSNLVTLSSVIPPGSEVDVLDGPTTLAGAWGNRVYCVLADNRTSHQGEEIWAGVGWFMIKDEQKGLFAEHVGGSRQAVEKQIKYSLEAFMKTRGLDPAANEIEMKVVGITCGDESACALVAAVYQSEAWA